MVIVVSAYRCLKVGTSCRYFLLIGFFLRSGRCPRGRRRRILSHLVRLQIHNVSGEVSGALRFAPGACQQKPDSHLIAFAFILDYCYARTYTAATAIQGISPSVPSTRSSPVAHTLALRWCLSWALRTLSIAFGGSISAEEERHRRLCVGLVLEGINARRHLWVWK